MEPNRVPGNLLGLLLRVKLRAAVNGIRRGINESPLRPAVGLILLLIVWAGLYTLFSLVFDGLRRTPLEATVALPLVFNVFFAAILIMLTFSNAILVFGTLFTHNESAYLRVSPIPSLDVVTLKYLESLALSSWSLILLGLPLMLAMAEQAEDPLFQGLFLAFFLAFIPIPGSLGLLAAWAAARFFPRRLARPTVITASAFVFVLAVWGLRSMRFAESGGEQWLHTFLERMSFVQSALLPNHWVASGIDSALDRRFADAFRFLGVTAANALFLSWLAVRFVSKHCDIAYDRAATGATDAPKAAASNPRTLWAARIFVYLPYRLRLMAAKDFQVFCRDPMQTSQLLILFGLLALYLTNMPNLRVHFSGTRWYLIMPFLNLCAMCLILATFTCRFVYPLPSLEGRHLWLVGLLPLPLERILIAKFAFAMTVTVAVALPAMLVATALLNLGMHWTLIHVGVSVAVCVGLCGLAVGLGARFPMLRETNVARIASGVGGTFNLLASLAMEAAALAAVGYATWRSRSMPIDAPPDVPALAICVLAALFAAATGLTALRWGGRYFRRLES
jgi:ABC-2 type transport system permease protein